VSKKLIAYFAASVVTVLAAKKTGRVRPNLNRLTAIRMAMRVFPVVRY
jgi:hypothetical protein